MMSYDSIAQPELVELAQPELVELTQPELVELAAAWSTQRPI